MSGHHKLLPLALLAALPTSAMAESDVQQWLSLSAAAEVDEIIEVSGEITARFGDASGGLYELEKALLLGYKLSPKVTAWAGYVHNPTYLAGDFVALERRAREQITFDDLITSGAVSLSARLRLEQRWRDGVEAVGWRARPYVKLTVPLGGRVSELNLTAEPFINLNTTSFQTTSGVDRLRSGVSLRVPLADAVKLDVGYLNQHRFVRNGTDRGDHVATASLAVSF